jgi:4-hydroxybenzoate polyprenyltransferase
MWRITFLPACAGLWNYATSIWLQQPPQLAEWCCATGATAFAYQLYRQNNIAVLGLVVAICSGYWLTQERQIIWLFAGILWWWYKLGARRIWWLKSIVVAVVWVVATCPVTSNEITMSWPLLVGRLGLVWALSLGYDVLDREYDQSQGVSTWALRMGGKLTLCQGVWVIWASYSLQWAFLPARSQWAMLVSLLWASWVLFRLYHQTAIQAELDILQQKMALDSAMLLQAILMIFLYL